MWYSTTAVHEVAQIIGGRGHVMPKHIENHTNWKNHVEQILPKFSATCFSIRNLIHSLNPDILHMVYFAYFSSSIWNNLLRKFNTCASSI
jgi:hypothetical protein